MSDHEESVSVETRVANLDAATLKSAMQQILEDSNAELVDWRSESLLRGSTQGKVFRVHGHGRSFSETLPWSFILKFIPSTQGRAPQYHNMSDDPVHFNYWRRELHFYQSALPSEFPAGLSAPRLYHSEEQTDGCWLWLEDISDKFEQDWPIERFGLAARHLGHFNGQYVDQNIPSLNWLVPHLLRERDFEQRCRAQDIWSQLVTLKQQHTILQRGWPDDTLARFTELWLDPAWLYHALESLPKTLIHGDAAHRNILARQGVNGADETVAIDWAFLGIGNIGQEISSVIFSTVLWFGLPASQLLTLDQLVFQNYVEGLNESGWQGDPNLVRLGYTAITALRYGAILSRLPELLALDEKGRKNIETLMGRPLEEIAHNSAIMREFVLSCATEARKLATHLGP